MKTLFLGSAPAAALGLLFGGFAHPELAVAPPPMQPVGTSFAWSSAEQAPDYAPAPTAYVSPADWRGVTDLPPLPEPEPEPEPVAVDTYAYAYVYAYALDAAAEAPAVGDEPAELTYPSVAGDILAGTEPERAPTVGAPPPEV